MPWWADGAGSGGQLTVHAIKRIPAGTEITFNYAGGSGARGSDARGVRVWPQFSQNHTTLSHPGANPSLLGAHTPAQGVPSKSCLHRTPSRPTPRVETCQKSCAGSSSSLVFWSSVLPDAILHHVLAVDEHVHDPRNGLIRKLTCALCESVVCALKGAVRIRSVR